VFSDPPLNIWWLAKKGRQCPAAGGATAARQPGSRKPADGSYTRRLPRTISSLERQWARRPACISCEVTVTEITGSESFVHLDFATRAGSCCRACMNSSPDDARRCARSRHMLVFDEQRPLVAAPKLAAEERNMARIDLVISRSPTAATRTRMRFRAEAESITWRAGRRLCAARPSGCGKTTLLNIISGHRDASRGQILFDGKDVTRCRRRSATSRRCSSSRSSTTP
jgi:ABC-type glutathione transport system ATPase component